MKNLRRFVAAFIWLGASISANAHPAHAEEVRYPFVAGFDRFYSDADPDEYLAHGGQLLIGELNCIACHQVPADGIYSAAPGPNLEGIGSRVSDGAALSLMIRNPRFLKLGTTMPSLFAGSDRDPDELDALLHFLTSLREEPGDPLLLGNVDRGRELYHSVGCVACHSPDAEVRPTGMPVALQLERPALASSSIRFATAWSADFLTRFLMDPVEYHPAGRMPNLALSEKAAADIAAYLKTTPSTEPVFEMGLPELEDQLVETGRALFASKGCASCHDAGVDPEASPAPALADLVGDLENGCLSETPVAGGVPHYFLSPLQRKAIQLALAEPSAPLTKLERELQQRDCYACHTIDGRGGPEIAREPFFGAFDPYSTEKESLLPPAIDTSAVQQLLESLTGKAERRRPNVRARMLVLPEAEARSLSELFGHR
ncbi:MAG: mono/diheme cytochrome c family protein [Verrucomicrobiales bacterium]